MRELLFEIGAEEIPARMLAGAEAQLGQLISKALEGKSLAVEEMATFATPRRLAVRAQVASSQEGRSEDVLGPPASVAFDHEGKPTRAAEGFAQRHGVDVAALETRETPRGLYLGVTVSEEGQPTRTLLPDLLSQAIRDLRWPKAMRWGAHQEPFIRPIQWLLALYDGEVVPVSFARVESGRQTRGHRFLHPEPFDVSNGDDWLEGLRSRNVEPDRLARRSHIEEGARALAAELGGEVLLDSTLLDEVTGLCEWPVCALGGFEEAYLDLPDPVLITSMKSHQKYVPIAGADGGLLRHFVVVVGTVSTDPDVVVAGNARVIRARLADARFFYEQDTSRPLAQFVPLLSQRLFLAGLGTMEHKASRLGQLATRLADELAPGDSDLATSAARAALLAKADLATAMVGEFASLQGEMGRDYARKAGEEDAVAEAIYEHYLPRHAGDDLPRTPHGKVVALADRLDSVVGCFALGLEPTGSQDPYGLRRQALAICRILAASSPAPGLAACLDHARATYGDTLDVDWDGVRSRILEFIRGRMKAALAKEHAADLAEAVLSVGFDQPADVHGRLDALARLKATDGWDELAEAVKRVARIVGDHPTGAVDPSAFTEEAARGLHDAWAEVHDSASANLDAGDYDGALAQLVTLKPAIDRFFDDVLVMSEDKIERARRLGLLAQLQALFGRVADFDKVST